MEKTILIETSARHIHLTQADLEILNGPGATLQSVRPLSQPGQFVSQVRLTLIGPKKNFDNVVVLGPVRPASQVEISLTDARAMGLQPPVRESGDIQGSTAITIRGSHGEIHLLQGCIIAKRHIHMTPDDAMTFQVKDKQVVAVKVLNANRSLIFGDVIVRVRKDFALAMHIDTDEANAAGIQGEVQGILITSL
jgi:putative phosphotransacetylase